MTKLKTLLITLETAKEYLDTFVLDVPSNCLVLSVQLNPTTSVPGTLALLSLSARTAHRFRRRLSA